MKCDFRPSFLHRIKKITDTSLKKDVERVIESVMVAQAPKNIPKLKKLQGYKIFYRIKFGNYRIGVAIENDLITFFECLPRKDFYKSFPALK